MKQRLLKIMIASLTLSFLAVGCIDLSQPHRRIDHYILAYPSPPMANRPATDAIIRVARFRVAPAYDATRIFFSAHGLDRNAFHYHRWRAHPGDITAHFLARDLRQSGLFQAVFVQPSAPGATHIVQGVVDEFFQDRSGAIPAAALTLIVTVTEADEKDVSRRLLFQKTYPVREACQDRTPPALAEAMSRAMARISESVKADLYDSLTRSGQ
jgi:cholesterol transport system auxiliary component